MNESSSEVSFYVLSIAQVLIALVIGAYLVRRSTTTRSHLQWSIGISLLVASLFSALALLWLYIEVQNTTSFGVLIILIATVLPAAVIGLVGALSFCLCVLWNSMHGGFVRRMGFLQTPSKSLVVVSVGVLTVAATIGVYILLPTMQLLPYRFLSSGSTERQITLTGIRYTGEFVPVISLHAVQGPSYNPTFRLQLDWRGRAILDVWQAPTATEPEATVTYYLPFQESVYRLDEGVPVAID